MITINRNNPTPGEITSSLTNASDSAGLHFADGGYIQTVNSAGTEFGTSDFSIEFILNRDSENSADEYIYFTHTSGNNRFRFLHDISEDKIKLTFINSGGSAAQYSIDYDIAADLNTPTHYALTCDRDGLATLYKNGNSVGTISISGSSGVDIGSSNTSLGQISSTATYGFIGTLYRFRTWNKSLTAAEVTASYENATVPFADQYGSQTELSTNTFVNAGFAGFSGNAGGFTTSGSSIGSKAYKNQTFTGGKKYRLKFTISDGNSADLDLNFRTAAAGAGVNAGKIESSNLGTIVSDTYLELSATGNYELILSDLGSVESIRIYSGADVGAVNLSAFSVVEIGCVSDYDLAFANPSPSPNGQSLMVRDRASAADGTSSASGVTQVTPIEQLNSKSARIGTSAATPADGDLLVSGNVGVGVVPTTQLHIKNATSSYDEAILALQSGNNGITEIQMGDVSEIDIGNIKYSNIDNSMAFTTNASTALTIDSGGAVTMASDCAASPASGNVAPLILGGATDSNKRLLIGYNTTANQGFVQAVNHTVAYSDLVIQPAGGNVLVGADATLGINTADESDTGSLNLSGGGAFNDARGASISLAGNESGNAGLLQLRAGTGSVGGVRMYAAGSEKARLSSTGLAVTGNVTATTLSTFSNGIALGNVASATATTLDGYEEGTFNLNTAGDATGVLLAQSGEYTRIGNCVYIRIAIDVNTTFTGNVLGGLPFGVYHSGDASSWATIGPVLKHSTSDLVLAGVQNGGTQVVKLWAGGNVSSAYLPNSTDRYYRFNGFYYTTDAY